MNAACAFKDEKMDIRKLLFVTRFEELRFDALQSLLDLRQAALEHIVFLNVIEREKVAMRRGAGYQKSEEIKLREKANIRFIDWAEYLFEKGMEVGVYIVVGSFPAQVIKAAEKETVDLIVIRPRIKGKLEKLYSGSDTTEIIKRSATPVLVYKHVAKEGKQAVKPFKRPLLAIDGSSAGKQGVECLKKLKGLIEQINVCHVVSEKRLKSDSAMAIQKARKDSRKKLEKICDLFEAEGIDARPHVYVGDTYTELEKAAQECRATLVVAGSPEKNLWKERWTGSLSRVLAEQSAFPVLLFPHR